MILLEDLYKRFDTAATSTDREYAVNGISLEVPEGRFVTLLGPSGCGKTTTLRMIAGLERPTAGRIEIGGEPVFDKDAGRFVPADRRSIGMVFQSYAIWPHMTVLENVAYPLTVSRKYKKQAARDEAMKMLDLVGLAALAERPAPDLSGGQQQRVALARALVRRPRVLLLDEPLSNLDAGLRDQMGIQLRTIQREVGITTVLVTHDQGEALAMSDVIVVMRDGEIMEQGAPKDIYSGPRDPFTAGFMGVKSVVRGTVVAVSDGRATVRSAVGLVTGLCPPEVAAGDEVELYLHPNGFEVCATTPGADACRGSVVTAVYRGDHVDYEISANGELLKVRSHGLPVHPLGADVWLTQTSDAALVVRVDATGRAATNDAPVDELVEGDRIG